MLTPVDSGMKSHHQHAGAVPRVGGWSAPVCALCLLLCGGCGATVTINVLSSHSRYGQAIGGTNTGIRGQIEGGGGNGAHASLTP